MIKNNFSFIIFPILILSLFLFCSCAQESFNLPDLSSESIKDYKYLVLTAGPTPLTNTGVHVEKGNLYSIIASGSIERDLLVINVNKDNKIGPKAGLRVKIGEKSQKVPPINATEQQQHPVKKGTVEGQLILSSAN